MRWLEYTLTATGLILLVLVALAYLDGRTSSAAALAAFEEAAGAAQMEQAAGHPSSDPADPDSDPAPLSAMKPDVSDWSAKRQKQYLASLQARGDLPTAVLRIPALELEVPVFHGTDTVALNRGAGLVESNASPGEAGNIAIAGHRDGFFRPLEGIPIGTDIQLQTLTSSQHFQVSNISIVDPLDTSVLDPTDETMLTLITCYPFRYVGFAPERYIVHASLTPTGKIPSGTIPTGNVPDHAETEI